LQEHFGVFRRYDKAMSGDRPVLPRVDAEVEQSRQSAARLLENLRRKLRRNLAVRNAAYGVERAARYVRGRSLRRGAAAAKRFIRREPVVALSVALAAGFLLGRAIGRKV
jgi:ElaB/YqjD/DUF883 family membrane-anchored ribosome-binding protein